MTGKHKASAQRDGDGFKVRVPRSGGADFYELYVHDDGRIDGLPGIEEDPVLIWIAEAEIRAEGWPSVGRAALKRHNLI